MIMTFASISASLAAVDRFIFRPLLGWATAWSFDRLRSGIEIGHPATSMQYLGAVARLTLALVWLLLRGIVPKLILHHPGELEMLRNMGLSAPAARGACVAAGWLEVAIGLMLIFAWRLLAPLWVTVVAMPAALIAVALTSPRALGAPFNPVSLNLSVFALGTDCIADARGEIYPLHADAGANRRGANHEFHLPAGDGIRLLASASANPETLRIQQRRQHRRRWHGRHGSRLAWASIHASVSIYRAHGGGSCFAERDQNVPFTIERLPPIDLRLRTCVTWIAEHSTHERSADSMPT